MKTLSLAVALLISTAAASVACDPKYDKGCVQPKECDPKIEKCDNNQDKKCWKTDKGMLCKDEPEPAVKKCDPKYEKCDNNTVKTCDPKYEKCGYQPEKKCWKTPKGIECKEINNNYHHENLDKEAEKLEDETQKGTKAEFFEKRFKFLHHRYEKVHHEYKELRHEKNNSLNREKHLDRFRERSDQDLANMHEDKSEMAYERANMFKNAARHLHDDERAARKEKDIVHHEYHHAKHEFYHAVRHEKMPADIETLKNTIRDDEEGNYKCKGMKMNSPEQKQCFADVKTKYEEAHKLRKELKEEEEAWIEKNGDKHDRELLEKYKEAHKEWEHEKHFYREHYRGEAHHKIHQERHIDRDLAKMNKKFGEYQHDVSEKFQDDADIEHEMFERAKVEKHLRRKKEEYLHKIEKVLKKREKYTIHDWKHALHHHDKKDIEEVQLDDNVVEESSSTVYGVSAAVVTGLVIGASYFMMNKRSNHKTGLETSLIDSQQV